MRLNVVLRRVSLQASMVEQAQADLSPSTAKAAVTAGILSGLLALAVIFGIGILLFGPKSERVPAASVAAGDCVTFSKTSGMSQEFDRFDCSDNHMAQITAQISFPENTETYPGSARLESWADEQCTEPTENFIGLPVLDTTLEAGNIIPNSADWESEVFVAACYVAGFDSKDVDFSLENKGAEFLRGDQTTVSRLKPGDCYSLIDNGIPAEKLLPSHPIQIVDCGGSYQGLFFGAAKLSYDADVAYLGEKELKAVSEDLCGALFKTHFETDGANFPYRYWEPSAPSWKAGYRKVHCTILDSQLVPGNFDPTEYKAFFNIEPGECFNIGPAISSDPVSAPNDFKLETQMKMAECSQPHVGQLVGTGTLPEGGIDSNQTPNYPGTLVVETDVKQRCSQMFEAFVGVGLNQSTLEQKYNFWSPDQKAWERNDRRFVCAIYTAEPQATSYQGSSV